MWRIKNKNNEYYTGFSWVKEKAEAKCYNVVKLNKEMKRLNNIELKIR
jgi:hypothetical protein